MTDDVARPAAYVLRSDDGEYLYKGSCRDLQKRMADHAAGRVSHTKNRRPLLLVHCEFFGTYTEARQREIWLKTGSGRDFIRSKLAKQDTNKR
jgi:putative endonuclease